MVTRISHTGLVVQDLDKQVAFYRDVIGLRILNEKSLVAPPTGDHTGIPGARRRLVFLGSAPDEHMLELVYYRDPLSPKGDPPERHQINGMHLCFEIENLQTVYKDLSEKGVRFLTPPRIIDSPEKGPVCLCYGQDPEGNWLEFIEELGDE